MRRSSPILSALLLLLWFSGLRGVAVAAGESVDSFTLYDADTDLPVPGFNPIATGAVINLATLPSQNLNIVADTTPPSDFGSVRLDLTGATTAGKVENVPPWALAGDSGGNLSAMTLNPGAHTMSSTPYDGDGGAGGGGAAGTGLSISFTVVNQPMGPPMVSITSPANGTTAGAPANFTVAADASDPGGMVTQVEFFEGGGNSLGLDTTAPYAVSWNGVSAGSYNLTARATDNDLNTTTSAPVTVNVVVPGAGGTVTGELKKWHKITVTFDGPGSGETATPNPFLDFKLDVTFTGPGGRQYIVPGYYAADGNAANTGATAGNKWRAHFAPDLAGDWSYVSSFVSGTNVAVDDTVSGVSTGFDGASGSFTIGASDKTGRDFRGKGRLRYSGGHYLQFAESKEYFLKQGADAPENFLAYEDFDGPFKTDGFRDDLIKTWSAHIADWNSGDPTWGAGKGKGIIGAVNYLASEGMNAFSFIPMNIDGDDKNVFPYLDYNERERLDVSRLDQWEIVFEHADALGMFLHFKTQETENELLLDGGNLGNHRRLYYRELIARFGHHLALNWNLGEEINNATTAQKQAWAQFFRNVDPYDHLIVIHNGANHFDLLGAASEVTGFSLQTSNADFSEVHSQVKNYLSQSANAGKPWAVACDEPGDAQHALRPDNDAGNSHVDGRKNGIWGTLLAGGWGDEWYFGYDHAHSDLTCEDFRSRDQWWDFCRHALEFFEKSGVPFWEMTNDNAKSSTANDYCFFKEGDAYIVYLKDGGTTNLDLTNASAVPFSVRWFDPRNGGELQLGTVATVTGGANVALGMPPGSATSDWVILVEAAKKILFIRGADRSGGFLEAGNDASRTEHLADIENFATNGGNHGWGELADTLRAGGFALEQMTELLESGAPPTGQTQGEHLPLESMDLPQCALVVFGSNNAVYDTAAIDALEAFVRGGGAALFISDGNFGSDWCDAPDSDQQFLDRFGLVMNQDRGTYTVDRAEGEFLDPSHPIFSGVNTFMGEGVSPGFIPAGAPPPGVAITRLAAASGATRDNDGTPGMNNCQGTNRPATASDGALVIAAADGGRLAIHFDRNTFFNLNGAGTDINEFDNRQYARNLFSWLANDPPLASAGPDQEITLPAAATLTGTVSDDGCPTVAGLTAAWSQASGPGAAIFADAASAATNVSFTAPGDYLLRLTGDDGVKQAGDDVAVTVYDSCGAWLARHFTAAELLDPQVSGFEADAEGDDVTVLLEYAFSGNPKVSDPGVLPGLDSAGDDFSIVFTRVKHATDLAYIPEVSETLAPGAWQSGPLFFTETVIADDGSLETVRATLNAATVAGDEAYLRVLVVKS